MPPPEPDPPAPPAPEPEADLAEPLDMSEVLSFRPDAPATCARAGSASCVAPCQRAVPAADELVLACWIGPLVGVARLVIGCWVSHGTVSLYGGRLPPGGTSGWTASSLVSACPNSPGCSE